MSQTIQPSRDLGASQAQRLIQSVAGLVKGLSREFCPFWSERYRPQSSGATFYGNDELTDGQVAEVLEMREVARRDSTDRLGNDQVRGRVLLIDMMRLDPDGIIQSESGGFFDQYGVPPWETWLAYSVTQDDQGCRYPVLACLMVSAYVHFVERTLANFPYSGVYSWTDELGKDGDFFPIKTLRSVLPEREFSELAEQWQRIIRR